MRQRGEGGGEGGEGEGAGDKGDGCFVYGVVFRVFRNVLNVRPSVRQGLKCSSAPHLCMVPRSINFLYCSHLVTGRSRNACACGPQRRCRRCRVRASSAGSSHDLPFTAASAAENI